MESTKLLTVEDKYKKVIYSLPLPIAEEIYPNFIVYHALELRKKYRWVLTAFFIFIILFILTTITMVIVAISLQYGVPVLIFFSVSIVIFVCLGSLFFRCHKKLTQWEQINSVGTN